MPKILKQICTVAALLILMVSGAQAALLEKRVLEEQTSSSQLPKLKADMIANGWGKEEGTTLGDVGRVVFLGMRDMQLLDLLHPEHRNLATFQKEFAKWTYSGGRPEDKISWAELQRKGQSKTGWKIPVTNPMVQAVEQVVDMQNKLASGQKLLRTDVEGLVKDLHGLQDQYANEVPVVLDAVQAMLRGDLPGDMVKSITELFADRFDTIKTEQTEQAERISTIEGWKNGAQKTLDKVGGIDSKLDNIGFHRNLTYILILGLFGAGVAAMLWLRHKQKVLPANAGEKKPDHPVRQVPTLTDVIQQEDVSPVPIKKTGTHS